MSDEKTEVVESVGLFDTEEYANETREVVFVMLSGRKLKAEYFINYMTEPLLRSLEDRTTKAMESDGILLAHEICAVHLAKACNKFYIGKKDAKGNVLPIPTDDEEKRLNWLKTLSYQDLQRMISQIGQDLLRPINGDETN